MASEKENQVIQNILAMIAKAEGTTKREGNPYDAIVGFGRFLKPGDNDPARNTPTANKPVSKMTFKEVKEFGRALVNATKGKNKDDKYKIGNDASGSSAVGKYQMLSNYFNTDGDGVVGNLQKKLRARGVKGFKDTDIFNERAQDLLAIELLKEKDNKLDGQKILTNYINNPNKQTIAKLMEKIASKWQGVPTAKPGRKNFQKREINYAQALDMIRLPESQYEFAGADERGLATTKNEPPSRNELNDAISIINKSKIKKVSKEEEKKAIEIIEKTERTESLPLYQILLNAIFGKPVKADEMRPRIDPVNFKSDIIQEKMDELIKRESPDLSPAREGDTTAKVGRTLREKMGDQSVIDPTTKEAEDILLGDMSGKEPTLRERINRDKNQSMPPSGIISEEATDQQMKALDLTPDTSLSEDPKKLIEGGRAKPLPEGLEREEVGRREDDPFDEEKLFQFDEGGDEEADAQMSFPQTPRYTILDPFDEDDNLTRARFAREEMNVGFDDPTPMGEADPKVDERDDPTDLSFFQRLFSGGFDFDMGRDSEAEENIGADYFYDEPMPMGGEADPRDESDDVIMNFNEGGEVKADFDGKDDEEEPADPPPLAKPKEVADDIPALLSEGEYVLPANVVRYLGVERIIEMHRRVLAEIQQMEDLGMIQNVDENGEPEQDDTEMKFAEGEEPEEGVTKGTIIIASAKPKGMMCPEPLMMQAGGDTGAGDVEDPTDTPPGQGQDDEDDEDDNVPGVTDVGLAGLSAPAGPGELGFEGRQEKGGLTDTEKAGMPDTEKAAFGLDETATELDVAFAKSKKGLIDRGLYGLGKLGERMGIDVTEKAAAGREAAEKDASQPGDMDFEFKDPEKITEDEIKVDQVIEDLQNKNVYIEGVGYIPLASLMSPRDDIVV